MSQASKFMNDHGGPSSGVCDIELSLDALGIRSDQDWHTETTVWTFDDGSKIVINEMDVTVLEP